MLVDLIWTVVMGSPGTHLVERGLAAGIGLRIAPIAADRHWRVGHGVWNAGCRLKGIIPRMYAGCLG